MHIFKGNVKKNNRIIFILSAFLDKFFFAMKPNLIFKNPF